MENQTHSHAPEKEYLTIKLPRLDREKILTIIISVTLILTLFNTYGIFFSGNDSGKVSGNVVKNTVNTAPSAENPTVAPSIVEVNIEGAPVLGETSAPVTIVEFSDYQCPFCGRHFQQTYPQLEKQYIQTGKAKLIFKDFPLSFHENAQKAAEAARCVKEQKGDEGYYKMHDKMFSNQESLVLENLKKFAREFGVDGAKFDSCLDSGKYASAVQQDMQDGAAAGVQGTPSFIINGQKIDGAQPFEAFRQIIEAELAK